MTPFEAYDLGCRSYDDGSVNPFIRSSTLWRSFELGYMVTAVERCDPTYYTGQRIPHAPNPFDPDFMPREHSLFALGQASRRPIIH
jgi:hypothetical protein